MQGAPLPVVKLQLPPRDTWTLRTQREVQSQNAVSQAQRLCQQECPARVKHKSVLRECPTSFARVSHKSVQWPTWRTRDLFWLERATLN